MILPIIAIIAAVDGGVALAPCKEKQIFCFSPGGDCDAPLITVMDAAKSSLDIAIYSINRQTITDAIARAKTRGVKVRVIIDASQAAQAKERTQLNILHDSGIEMKRDSHVGIMHWKLTIADDNIFVIGSFNYTDPAVDSNDEYMMIWSCPRNALIFKSEFDKRWYAKVGFKDASSWWPDGGI